MISSACGKENAVRIDAECPSRKAATRPVDAQRGRPIRHPLSAWIS